MRISFNTDLSFPQSTALIRDSLHLTNQLRTQKKDALRVRGSDMDDVGQLVSHRYLSLVDRCVFLEDSVEVHRRGFIYASKVCTTN